MEESKEVKKLNKKQKTLVQLEHQGDIDDKYGHLVEHLIQQDIDPKDTNQWTRVFGRDTLGDKQLAIHLIGPDLLYNDSIRASLSLVSDGSGEVVFSPMMFSVEDLSGELEDSQLKDKDLIGLGHLATQVKDKFAKAVEDLNEEQVEEEQGVVLADQNISIKLKRDYSLKKQMIKRLFKDSGLPIVDRCLMRKTLKKNQLSH